MPEFDKIHMLLVRWIQESKQSASQLRDGSEWAGFFGHREVASRIREAAVGMETVAEQLVRALESMKRVFENSPREKRRKSSLHREGRLEMRPR